MAIDASEEIARKGQEELREMTRDLDLLKIDVDLIANGYSIARCVHASERASQGRGDDHEAATSS